MRKKTLIPGLLLLMTLLSACNPYQKAMRKHNQLSDRQQLELRSIFIEGTRYRILGDAESAMAVYQRILDEDPLHDGALFELAKLKLVTGETDQAAELMKTAIKVDPNNIWYALGYATVLEKTGRYSDAAVQYKNLQATHPASYELYGYEAECYVQDNQFQKAIDTYNRLEGVVGFTEEACIQRYYIYMNWGKSDKAMSEIQKLADQFPENTEYSMALAGYYMRAGKAGLAYQSINNVLAVEPDNALARAYLADYYHFSGNDMLAVREISSIISNPNTGIDEKISIFLNILQSGSIYGDSTSVFPLLDTLVKLHPTEAKSWAMYADFLNAADRTDEAVIKWKRSLELDSSRFQIWELVLNGLYDGKQADSLLLYAGRAADLFPEQATVWFFLGAAQVDAGKYIEAETSLEMASDLSLSKKEMKTQMQYLLAETYLKNGKVAKSDEMFELLISNNPDNAVAKNRYAYSLAVRNKNISRAAELIGQVIAANSDKIDFQHTRALVLFREAKFKDAVDTYEQAMHLGGEKDGALLEHYADALFFLGRVDEAVRFWQNAREMGGAGLLIDKKITDKKYYE